MSQHAYTLFTHWNHWHWGLLAVGLTLLELLIPTSLLLWLGLAAGVVSGALFVFPAMGWLMTTVLFLLVAGVAVGLSRLLSTRRPPPIRRPARRLVAPGAIHSASQQVGRLFTLTEPIRDGIGTLPIGNMLWTIRGLDMAAGTPVKVVGFEGTILSVEAMEQNATGPDESPR
ncbi:MAG: NfeD family protein [Magnetococcus sp. DMHC-8]